MEISSDYPRTSGPDWGGFQSFWSPQTGQTNENTSNWGTWGTPDTVGFSGYNDNSSQDRLPPDMLSAMTGNYAAQPQTNQQAPGNGAEPAPVLTGPDRPAPTSSQLPPRVNAPTQIVGRPENADPSKRNVIVLDDFRKNDQFPRGTSPRSHGEVISRPLETQGYNVYRVQSSEMDAQKPYTGKQGDIDHLADRIQRGEIPARAGDIVNMSFGQDQDMTFKDVNRLAGYTGDQTLTRENLTPEKAQALRERFQERLNDPSNGLSAKDRENLTDMLKSANGIDRLKAMGLIVVNAGGNEGADSLHPGMLNSTHILQNRNGNGTFDESSARHALTEPARGSFVTNVGSNGVDVNNDGIPDFERGPTGAKTEDLSGTSFSVLEWLRRNYPPGWN